MGGDGLCVSCHRRWRNVTRPSRCMESSVVLTSGELWRSERAMSGVESPKTERLRRSVIAARSSQSSCGWWSDMVEPVRIAFRYGPAGRKQPSRNRWSVQRHVDADVSPDPCRRTNTVGAHQKSILTNAEGKGHRSHQGGCCSASQQPKPGCAGEHGARGATVANRSSRRCENTKSERHWHPKSAISAKTAPTDGKPRGLFDTVVHHVFLTLGEIAEVPSQETSTASSRRP